MPTPSIPHTPIASPLDEGVSESAPGASAPARLARLTAADLVDLNARLESLPAAELLRWAHSIFGERLAALSAFQKAGCVVCHHLFALGLHRDVDVVFVDTGVNFRETYETLDQIESRYGLSIVRLHPAKTMAEQTRDEGVLYLSVDGQKRCCALRKKEPLRQIVGRYDALIGSLRRADGGKRSDAPVLAIDEELNLLRIHPLLAWDDDSLNRYIQENEVIVNPLHGQGYPTISCDRCTSPVLPGEPERAGRWRHLENAVAYCNINPTDRAKNAARPEPAIHLPADLAEKILRAAAA